MLFVLEIRHCEVHVPGVKVILIIRGRPGEDGIEIFRIALRLHEALAPSRGATVPIREARRPAVKRTNDCLRSHSHLMDGTGVEINQFFRVPECEGCVAAGALVTRVGRSGSVAFLEGFYPPEACRIRATVFNVTRPAAVPNRFKFPVPIRRKPDFHFDMGVGGGRQDCGDAAVRGQHNRWILRLVRRAEQTGRDGLGSGNGGVRKRERLKPLAGSLRSTDCHNPQRQRKPEHRQEPSHYGFSLSRNVYCAFPVRALQSTPPSRGCHCKTGSA